MGMGIMRGSAVDKSGRHSRRLGSRFPQGRAEVVRSSFLIALLLCLLGAVPVQGQDIRQKETDLLAKLLHWQPGSDVAEIGAGDGEMTLAASQFVGPAGKVYSTELDPKKLEHLKELAAKQPNITVLPAAEADTNLPPDCCDSIFMRLVYHHLTKPAEIDASLFRALKPGGLLAVIDMKPAPGSSIPEGVPKNRGGHGMPQTILASELEAAGFQVVADRDPWPDHDANHETYCVVARKPGP